MEFLIKRCAFIPILVFGALSTGCGYNDFSAPDIELPGSVMPNAGIGFIRSLCGDGVYTVKQDIVIGGYVTANDRGGNIYRSFFIEDGSGAAEIRAGMYSLHNVYIRGRYVAVKMEGLAVTLVDGVLRVGFPPSEGYNGVEYLDSWAVAADYLFPSAENITPEALPLTVSQLTEDHCGRLVRLNHLRLKGEDTDEDDPEGDEGGEETTLSGFAAAAEEVTWAYPPGGDNAVARAAYRYFEDMGGETVAVYTSGYADFAGKAVPGGLLSVTGILSYGNAEGKPMFILRLRDENDAVLQVGR